jgi:outer membrane immunogenic protein
MGILGYAAIAAIGVLAVFDARPVSAQRLPTPPMAPVLDNWSGPFVGLNAGYGSGHSDQTDRGIPVVTPPPPPPPTIADGHYPVEGGFVGGTAGYNWQLGPWVFGILGDYSWADISGSSSVCGPNTVAPHPCGTKLDSFGTFRGRLGYAVGPTDSLLPYITGGLAVGNVHGWDSLTPAAGTSVRAGWTVGAGVEAKVARQWSLKFEYLHIDLGSARLFNVVPGVPETVSLRSENFSIGLNYYWDGPITTKY